MFCSVSIWFPWECMDYVAECGRLTLVGFAVPTRAAVSLPSSSGQGRENLRQGSWAEMRAGGDHLAITVMSKTDSAWGNLFNLMANQSRVIRSKTQIFKKILLPFPSLEVLL